MNEKRILFIGAGRMAQAIIEGLSKNNEFSILVANNGNQDRLIKVRDTYGVEITNHWQREVHKMDIVLIAAPPEVYEPILADLTNLIQTQLIVSIAGGIGPTYLEEKLPKKTPVVWIMPNTAAKLGKSMTLYSPSQHVNQEHLAWTEALICGIGEFERVSEKQLLELTAVTGSASAFIYRFAEALEKITLESGVNNKQARKFVTQMILGSAEMLRTNVDPSELADEVATPGGSTAAGLEVLDTNQFADLIGQAIAACREKAKNSR